jgi:hypothetical protein
VERYLFVTAIFQDDLTFEKARVHSAAREMELFGSVLEIIHDCIDECILEQVWGAIEVTAHAFIHQSQLIIEIKGGALLPAGKSTQSSWEASRCLGFFI